MQKCIKHQYPGTNLSEPSLSISQSYVASRMITKIINIYAQLADKSSQHTKKLWTLLKQVHTDNAVSSAIPSLEVSSPDGRWCECSWKLTEIIYVGGRKFKY